MNPRCVPLLAVLLAAPIFAQPERPVPNATAIVPHWPERFGPDSFLHWSQGQPSAALALSAADSVVAVRTSPEARAEAAIVDPGIMRAPDSTVDARMRLLVPPAHADSEMMRNPGPARSPKPEATGKRPARHR